jgi:hypothetical protein
MSTMRDPVRLVLDPSCPDSQRELLRHGAAIEPPRGAEDRVWRALGAALGAVATADASTKTVGAATKVEAAGLTGAKLVVVIAALAALAGLVALGGYLVASPRDARPPAAVAVAPAAAPSPSLAPPAAAAPWGESPPADTGHARTAPGARHAVRGQLRSGVAAADARAASAPASRLREETTLIKEARQSLRQGDVGRALRELEECRRLFPAGVLEQERDRLIVEALVAAGRAREASARAAEFLRRYPDSPHAGEVRELGLRGAGGR